MLSSSRRLGAFARISNTGLPFSSKRTRLDVCCSSSCVADGLRRSTSSGRGVVVSGLPEEGLCLLEGIAEISGHSWKRQS